MELLHFESQIIVNIYLIHTSVLSTPLLEWRGAQKTKIWAFIANIFKKQVFRSEKLKVKPPALGNL
jgi:hypothetical protein